MKPHRTSHPNSPTHADFVTLDLFVRMPDGTIARPTLNLATDAVSGLIMGWNVS